MTIVREAFVAVYKENGFLVGIDQDNGSAFEAYGFETCAVDHFADVKIWAKLSAT